MKLDPALIELLSLDPANTTISSHGGGGMSSASTYKLTTKLLDGSEKKYFIKTGRGADAAVMFAGEHASLNAIHAVVPSLCPSSLGHGAFASTPSTFYLATDVLDISPSPSPSPDSSSSPSPPPQSLAAKLATLHTTPAPIPAGYSNPVFGFPVPTCCGDTPQPNPYTASWATFFAQHRLAFILSRCAAARGSSSSSSSSHALHSLVTRTLEQVVPRLLGDARLNGGKGATPVVVHGDLWSGNKGRGRIGGVGAVQEVVFDPASAWACAEYEEGIMRMFGGFGAEFWREYDGVVGGRGGAVEPRGERGDRVKLYQVYHYLNHYALFGGGYRSSAVGIMEELLKKYGTG